MKEAKKITTKKDKLAPIWHPTQHDESDELEEAKKATGADATIKNYYIRRRLYLRR